MTPIQKKYFKRLVGVWAIIAMFLVMPQQGIARSADAFIEKTEWANNTTEFWKSALWSLPYGQLKRNFIILCHTSGGLQKLEPLHDFNVETAAHFNTTTTSELSNISGKKLVCPNETTVYSVPTAAPGTTWSWTLASGGQIISATNNSVIVKWNNQPGTGQHKLSVKVTDNNGVSEVGEYLISIRDIYLNCISSLNIGVDNSCKATLTTERMLSSTHIGSAEMKIQIIDISRNRILEEGIGSVDIDGVSKDGVSYDFIGRTFTTKVIEPCNNNYCLGSVKVSDYSAPMLTAPADVSFSCAQLNGFNPTVTLSGAPVVTDCSPGSTYNYSDVTYENVCTQPFTALPAGVPAGHTLPTTGDVTKILVRTFTATDRWGNSSECQQVLFIRRADLKNFIGPKDTVFECSKVPVKFDPSVTGAPMLDVDGNVNTINDRYEPSQSCQVYMKPFVDDTIMLCAGSYRITRQWTLLSLCATDDPATTVDETRKTFTQTITVLDKTPPAVTAQFTQYRMENSRLTVRDTTVQFDGYEIQGGESFIGFRANVYPLSLPISCGGKMRMVLKATDLTCSKDKVTFMADDPRVQLVSGYPQFNNVDKTTTAIFEATFSTIGDYVFTIYAKDVCGFALSKKTFRVLVRDNLIPQAVCSNSYNVSLTNNGSARVQATMLDGGSADNCGIDHMEVKRMINCQNPADTLFKPYVDFYCCDAGKSVMVTLRVYDAAGNYNDCMMTIYVEDRLKPSCIPPAPTTITCKEVPFNDFSQYGQPALWDNCSLKDTVYTVVKNLDNCGVGTVTRKWVISDFTNKKDSCTQTISVQPTSDFTVDFPDDIYADCFAAVPTLEQAKKMMLTNTPDKDGHIVNNGCGTLYVEIKDDTLTSAPGACYMILRKITVIDWCKLSLSNGTSDWNNVAYGQPVCGDIHSNTNWATQNASVWDYLNHTTCATNSRERRFRDADNLVATSSSAANPVSANAFSDGVISFTQIISITDKTPPQFTVCNDTIIKDGSVGCEAAINITVKAEDLCNNTKLGSEGLTYNWTLFSKDNPNAIIAQGFSNKISATLPYGKDFVASWMVMDRCGNQTFKAQNIKVVDSKTPSIICLSKNAELASSNGTGMVTVKVTDVLQGMSDNCTGSTYLNDKLIIVKASANPSNVYPSVKNTSVTYTCSDVGKKNLLQIWTVDEAGNANFCISEINVQDNLNACGALTQASISGGITTESAKNVPNVVVTTLQNGTLLSSITTTTTGTFSSNNLVQGNSYQVKASRNDNVSNGISTLDIALISKHILGLQPLTSPYKLIAADVNRDGDISGADIIYERRLVLKTISQFPNNTSWRFVDKNYVFPNAENPFETDFPETVNFSSLPQTAKANFVAIKVGDVNNSVNPTNLTGSDNSTLQVRSAESLDFEVEDRELIAGMEYTVTFKTSDFKASGYQFTLNHTEGVEVIKIINGDLPSMNEGNFGQFRGALTTSWNGNFNDKNADVFSLVLKAKKNVRLSEILTIGSNITGAEAYDKDGNLMNINLQFTYKNSVKVESEAFNLYQNEPNPFDSETKISFNLPKDSRAKLTIFDATGRIVKVVENQYSKGYNAITVQRNELENYGIYFYRLDTPTHTSTKKMIITQ